MQYFQRAVAALKHYYDLIKAQAHNLWARSDPWRQRIVSAGMALYASFSTFKSSLELAPIIFSGLTILATAPLLSYFLPAVMFDTTILIIILGAVSGMVGYSKYKELELRKQLDNQIQRNDQRILLLQDRVTCLEQRLTKFERLPEPHHSPTSYYLRSRRQSTSEVPETHANVRPRTPSSQRIRH